jgi:AcrR family transcriptional regulator
MPINAEGARKAPKTRVPARDRLLKAAAKRFYADGLTATGIDAVTSEAGVAKMSLYNNFASKSELIVAYLHERHEEWLDLYRRRLSEAGSPQDRVLAVFDAYIDHSQFEYERGFRGCGLLNAAAELPAGDPGREVVRAHKEEVESLLDKHLGEVVQGRGNLDRAMGRHLAFLLEGAMARAGLEGNVQCLRDARSMAETMVSAL